jgi:hypothetical protein
MGKRGRAEDKGKGEGDDLIGILKVVAFGFSVFRFKNSKRPALRKQQTAS